MDIEAILEMYEDDYNPSSKVPGPRNMADDVRMGFNKGLKVPKYPDLRMFPPIPNKAQAKAKAKILNKFKKDVKKYILKEIKDFKKTALPKEKYQLIENEIHRAMGYDQAAGKKPSKTLVKYVKEVIEELPKDGTWESNKTGKGS
jgi:preprotein translocase subunit SecE